MSIIDSWENVLKEMTKDFEIYYLETREKGSAKHPVEQDLSIASLGDDLSSVLVYHNLFDKPYILFGSSLGGTVILDAMSKMKVSPTMAVLIGPNAEFQAPRYWLWIIRMVPPILFYFIKPLAKWYMKKKYINMEADPKQYEKYARALDQGNPSRMRRSALNCSKYKIWEKLGNIHQKVLIFTGSQDVLHGYENTVKIAELLPNCELVDLVTNARTHSVEMVNQLRSFLKEDVNV
ncbi:MAG TPA: alpha/beta hydrolase [Candidatus Marinimicrobia bacterium]|nr:alpha/beta hydrolase [Candidatus Neomarinimicrobiota bacterium]